MTNRCAIRRGNWRSDSSKITDELRHEQTRRGHECPRHKNVRAHEWLSYASAAHQVDHQDDEGDHLEDVDETSRNVQAEAE